MCGIAGVLNFDGSPVDPRALKRMTDAIAHRGPDGEGHFFDKGVGLGHRRLAIIDLSPAGHQPMVSDDRRFALTYNGEVYNFKEIRKQLENLGHKFCSNTDSEVVLHSWAEWGRECVTRFNGMFAFAIWDSLVRSLHLVRDRYGIKPLYYGVYSGSVVFGSEQRAIQQFPGFVSQIDEQALLEYFTFQNIFTDKTLTKGTHLLPPASILSIGGDGSVNTSQYWDFEFQTRPGPVVESDYLEELQYLLHQAVSRQLVSDVEIGSYLSGGIDSGTVATISSRALPMMKTFTCGFDLSSATGRELRFDERVQAEALASLLHTEHFEIVLNSSDMERCLDTVVAQLEEPRVGQSYPNYLIARLASKFVKVVMTGVGGDELFGGYPWRYFVSDTSLEFDQFASSYYKTWHRLVSNRELRQIFAPIWPRVSEVNTEAIFRNVFKFPQEKLTTYENYVNSCLYFEAKTFLPGLLVVEDKLSMAHGLETRVPLLDNDLVDFAMRCPISMKVPRPTNKIAIDENLEVNKTNYYYETLGSGKHLLRQVMSSIVPRVDPDSRKQGFSAPDSTWFMHQSRNYVMARLVDSELEMYNYLDYRSVMNAVEEHVSGKRNRRLLIWSLLSMASVLSGSN